MVGKVKKILTKEPIVILGAIGAVLIFAFFNDAQINNVKEGVAVLMPLILALVGRGLVTPK